VVEVDEEGPVHEPRPGMQLYEGGLRGVGVGGGGKDGTGGSRIDGFAKGVELFEGNVPSASEDVGSEFAPVSRGVEVVISGKDTEVV